VNENSEIQWGLTAIPFVVNRSVRRKTVALTMDQGKLVVTAPHEVSLSRLNDVVRRKAAWVVLRMRRAAQQLPLPPEREFVTGETVLYRGRQLRLKVVETCDEKRTRMWAGWYEVSLDRRLHGDARRRELRIRLAASLREHAERHLPMFLSSLCDRFQVRAPELLVREQHKRWGSCDTKGVLRINWRIIQCSQTLIDYVLAHELVHRQHRTHGTEFWSALARWMPDYEQRRQRLRELGPFLVW
jgi:predicted metal-dependent hydrolase